MVTHDIVGLASPKLPYSRRRRVKRGRVTVRVRVKAAPSNPVQPGQLASPFLKFGFPSLALH